MIEQNLLEVDRVGVLKKINKTEKDIDYFVQQVLDWLDKQPHLPNVKNRSQYEYLLIHNKFNLERTTNFLDKYYLLKHVIPEVFDNWDISTDEIKKCLYTNAWLALPKMTENFERVTIFRLLNNDSKVFNPWDLIKCYYLTACARIHLGDFNAGEHIVFDMAGFKLEHFLKFTAPSFQRKYKILMEGKSPIILKGIHYLNMPVGLDIVLRLAKLLLKPKMLQRLYNHYDLSSLHKNIPKEILPKEYGGDEPPFMEMYDKRVQAMVDNSKLFVLETENKSDESKRVNKIYKNVDSVITECDGTFRKLEID